MMNYHQDWLMRQIEIMIIAIERLCFKRSTSKSAPTTDIDSYKKHLTMLIEKGNYHDAENYANRISERSDTLWLELIVYYYSLMNKFPDSLLRKNNYSRVEMAEGLKEICKELGIDTVLGL